jgi:hypothetical protein
MKILEISDDSGFLGLANFGRYKSFISGDWDFKMMKKRIIEEMNACHLIFWATGSEGTWKVNVGGQKTNPNSFREDSGLIEVTDGTLFLTNYESLTMAAQFEQVKLPLKNSEDLLIEVENGRYLVKFRQLFDPNAYEFDENEVNFEILLKKIESNPDTYCNNINEIFWSEY